MGRAMGQGGGTQDRVVMGHRTIGHAHAPYIMPHGPAPVAPKSLGPMSCGMFSALCPMTLSYVLCPHPMSCGPVLYPRLELLRQRHNSKIVV